MTPAEGAGLERMRQLLSDYEVRSARVLAVVAELRTGTIDRVLAKSDLELGLEAMGEERRKRP